LLVNIQLIQGVAENNMVDSDLNSHIDKEAINGLPLGQWTGQVLVVSETDNLSEIIPALQEEKILGFDTETRPAFRKGQHFSPALLQLSTADIVFIFQLSKLGIPESVLEILSNKEIIKAGVSLDYDLRELKKTADFSPHGFVDLAKMAKKLGIKNQGLRGLCGALLGFRISKSARTSNWSKKQLSPSQICYAATDAWVGRELFLKMERLLVCKYSG
jgi:ribonuclease D